MQDALVTTALELPGHRIVRSGELDYYDGEE